MKGVFNKRIIAGILVVTLSLGVNLRDSITLSANRGGEKDTKEKILAVEYEIEPLDLDIIEKM